MNLTTDKRDHNKASRNSTEESADDSDAGTWPCISAGHEVVAGPNGNNILPDSPIPSELPLYAEPDIMSSCPETPAQMASRSYNKIKESKSTSSNDKATPLKSESSREKPKPRRVIGNFTLVNTLGSGSMGKVRLAVHNITGDKLAVKIVSRVLPCERQNSAESKKKRENREIRTIREASLMLLLHHPHIVSLKEMVVLDPYYYLFMEYVNGGQLLDYIISHRKLKEKQARNFARQIASALDYCHRNSIVHRDLKIENILISQSGQIKIIDFGLSNLFSPRSHLSTFCGSLYFAAPELLNARSYTGPEVDVWSFGVVLYVLVCGKVPFDDQNMPILHEKIKRGVVDYPSHLSSECKNILSRMLVTNPAHRATMSEIIVHPWMNKGYDGPVDNHLPERAPLSLPVDPEVIHGMTGFEFGTEAEIKEQLEAIITSEEYQKAAKILAERSAEANRVHHHSRFTHPTLGSRKSFSLSNNDPQSVPYAYHPLVSIYHLVKERMEREKKAADHSDEGSSVGSTPSSDDVPLGVRMPEISIPESSYIAKNSLDPSIFADNHEIPLEVRPSHHGGTSAGVAYTHRGKANIRVDDEGHIVETDRPNLLNNSLTRFFSRSSTRNSEHTSRINEDEEESKRSSGTREPNVFRRLSQVLSRVPQNEAIKPREDSRHKSSRQRNQSADYSTDSAPIPIPSKSDSRWGKPRPSRTKTYVHPNSLPAPNSFNMNSISPPDNQGFGQKMTHFFSRMTSTGSSDLAFVNASKRRQSLTSSRPPTNRLSQGKAPIQTLPKVSTPEPKKPHDHEQVFPPTVNGVSCTQQGSADENIRPVFIKGLFSVTTTSTKHPSVIRADLIRVLERIGVKWREGRGRFECVHIPSIDMKRVVKPEDEEDDLDTNNNSYDSEDLSSSPSEGASSASGQLDPAITTQAQSPTPVTVPDLVVRFEIYIVKVPWLLGMHGLQFRRVSGDSWQYKNMCSRILAELKL
ncbi:hypothetical protein CLU79DRAFT_746222 [Phycomyces nitens]|nr:hypothetical protein CLU79DRAFT_746222 [Phycomyces nitens]